MPAVHTPLAVGPYQVWPPVVLAPMAGITNPPFRALCREQATSRVPAADTGHPAGLFVCEMVTTVGLVEGNPKTRKMIHFEPDEQPRSVQLYGVDPDYVGRAVRIVAEEDLADHIDLNFGCPVPKVTRRGGGCALPYHRVLFRNIVRAAVRNAGALPVTVKMRVGIDPEHETYLEAGRIAEDEGVAAVALHARTGAQGYSGEADWDRIAKLKAELSGVPVLGNGDIWEGADALRMMAETGADGVVVGRGCLGRPWLFADLAAAFVGGAPVRPCLGEVAAMMRRHAEGLVAMHRSDHGVREFRKHVAWYLKGFPVGSELRGRLAQASNLPELEELLARLDRAEPWPAANEGSPRGRSHASERRVTLPYGWLENPDDPTPPTGAETDESGG
ncbi:tRNA dihydrouridine synthase DusB [Actinocrinis puniceicyclus]|uniref:tRNA-dihydrouridine synthase n=1 Tax=Actinocrinis puniceicyclus TaxID=977794 RepID=A0A8J7WS46_9ACTN|nr:tRNA dihydrouridine synthase DusB [Actinocrinis puniceicyclus]MBS2964324.1 tRNA dihydrouridine synthase DusB [Actinocrinis puniceicyclus]